MHPKRRGMGPEALRTAPIPKIFFQNAIPSMLGMLLVLAYNMADLFFVGQTGDPIQIAAVSVATPAFMLFTALGTIFGVGGASCISRALGGGDHERANHVSSFCFWAALSVGAAGSVCFLILTGPILTLLGASDATRAGAGEYLRIVAISAPFILLSGSFQHILRAEGRPALAVAGMIGGNLLNIVLDPVLILAAGLGVAGAAWATAIANILGGLVYLVYLLSGRFSLSISPRAFRLGGGVAAQTLSIGFPASLQSILMSVASAICNKLLVQYGDLSVAAMGVATKIDMVVSLLMIGLSQGVMSAVGFLYGAHDRPRAKKLLRFSAIFAVALGSVVTVLCLVFSGPIVRAFIDDAETQALGQHFVRCLLTTGPVVGLSFLYAFALQALGEAMGSLLLSLTRQCLAYIPALYLLNALFGQDGIAFALPVANIIAIVLGIALFVRADRKQAAQSEAAAPEPVESN